MNVVIVNCFDTYEHRVDILHNVLTKNRHEVRVFTSNFCHFEKIKRTESREDFKFFEAETYQKNLSYKRLHSHVRLSKDIFGYLENQADNVDLLWVLVPPNSFVKDAAKFKKNHPHTKLIFDLIDLWPETMPIGFLKNIVPFTIWKNLRNKNIRCADFVITECSLYQEKLRNVLAGINTETLYLARPLVTYEPHLNLPEDRINLCYLGSINNIIDIGAIAEIISEFLKSKPVELHIVGDGEHKDELIRAAEKAGAAVVFHGKIYDREEKQDIFDSCQYGLNIMKKSVCVGLTMKSMDYMEFGLPLLNNIHGDTWSIVEKIGCGINIESGNDPSNGLASLSVDKELEMRKRCRRFFEENLVKDIFEKELLKIITQLM